jgi:hypothetical protein
MPIPLAFQHYLIPLRSQKKNPRRKTLALAVIVASPSTLQRGGFVLHGVLVDPDR